jgi:uncharacterized protein
METKVTYFERSGDENTEATFNIARCRAGELSIKNIVVATTSGDTAAKAVKMLKGFRVIAVSHVAGMYEPNAQELTEANRKLIESQGGAIVTAAHAFSGVSAAMRNKFNTYVVGDIMSNTLRTLGQGVKVACEISMMAADAGFVRIDEDIIAIGGTAHGADTALVITPANSHRFFDLKVREILCKPRL